MNYDILDMNLAEAGKARIEWAEADMPVLKEIGERFAKDQTFAGVRIGCCMHVTTETANLMRALVAGGAEVALCASNLLSTQDDVAAALVKYYDVQVYAIKGVDTETYYRHIDSVIDFKPQIVMDDGCDVVSRVHSEYPELLDGIIGGTEETTTGVIRLKAMAADGALKYPIVAVNDANTKHMFDNRYGTGQSTIDGIVRATNRLLAGRTVVVSGYGWCGKGAAMRAEGIGANVIVCEIDPLMALEAVMDGHRVMPAAEAAKEADVWITVTGNINVIDEAMFANLKDGAILCNSGHFNCEINIPWLRENTVSSSTVKPLVEEFVLHDGRKLYLLADGRLVNLACAEGHPASVMDMSFANQALAAEWMLANRDNLEPSVIDMPRDIDDEIAKLKLESMGVRIDVLTPEQEKYLASWTEGTV
ncbi:MAG: adenosylhomocysteinase [Coriobacteriia bacterium]|nr:adenosylhomocysteinase [Coriobacteriia bacterium]MCL2871019.1 adenosylhomocysteinase [Coriobacteriia bacterium]